MDKELPAILSWTYPNVAGESVSPPVPKSTQTSIEYCKFDYKTWATCAFCSKLFLMAHMRTLTFSPHLSSSSRMAEGYMPILSNNLSLSSENLLLDRKVNFVHALLCFV